MSQEVESEWELSLQLTKWFIVGWGIVKRDDCKESQCSGADKAHILANSFALPNAH